MALCRRACLRFGSSGCERKCMVLLTSILLFLTGLALTRRDLRPLLADIFFLGRSRDKWVVLHASELEAGELSFLQELHPQWQLLVLADPQSAHSFRSKCPRCVVLTGDYVTSRGLRSPSHWPHVSGRLHGYLYAISHGARYIYNMRGTVRFTDNLRNYFLSDNLTALLYAGGHVFRPRSHFGRAASAVAWGRDDDVTLGEGFPTDNGYFLGTWPTPLVQKEVLAPSVEFSSQSERGTPDLQTAEHAPPVVLKVETFAAMSLENALYQYDAFWALFAAGLTSFRSEEVAGYVVQRLLWEVGGNVGFLPPRGTLNTGEDHSALNPDISRKDTLGMQALLREWRCPPENSLKDCILNLPAAVFGAKSAQARDVLEAWLTDLQGAGYRMPRRQQSSLIDRTLANQEASTVYYAPPTLGNSAHNDFSVNSSYLASAIAGAQVDKICKRDPVPIRDLDLPRNDDILLVVVFNFPRIYGNIPLLLYLYSRYFSKIAFCGEDLYTFQKSYASINSSFTFIHVEHYHGFLGYECVMKAMRMSMKVDGFLHIGDDVLLSPWNFQGLPRHSFWFQRSIRKAELSAPAVPDLAKSPQWSIWNSMPGRRTLVPLWEALRNQQQHGSPRDQQLVSAFLRQLFLNTNSSCGVLYEASDIFYVPQTLGELFLYFADEFLKHGVFLEIAVPTILGGLSPLDRVVRLDGSYLWYKERNFFAQRFSEHHHFLHAWKLSQQLRDMRGRNFFCQRYLPLIERV